MVPRVISVHKAKNTLDALTKLLVLSHIAQSWLGDARIDPVMQNACSTLRNFKESTLARHVFLHNKSFAKLGHVLVPLTAPKTVNSPKLSHEQSATF